MSIKLYYISIFSIYKLHRIYHNFLLNLSSNATQVIQRRKYTPLRKILFTKKRPVYVGKGKLIHFI